VDQLKAHWEEQLEEAHRLRVDAIQSAAREKESERRELLAKVSTLESALNAALSARPALTHPAPSTPPTSAPKRDFEPLRAVVDRFLATYTKERKPAMFKKHQPALQLLRELHGEKPINELRQADVVDYFNVVHGLPPRWQEKRKKRRMSARELAEEEPPERLSKKTFEDNYVVPVRLFFKWARLHWQDEGFPVTLTTEGVEFLGDDDEGLKKQRAFNSNELTRLFHTELAGFRADGGETHKWWLPVLAFYTGARVNELCQVNPQTDVGTSKEGIPYILVTEDTEGDERVRKSVKTRVQRYVPLHPELIEGGFLTYLDRVRKTGSKLLFPAWTPTNSRASTQAERWFRDFLRAKGLRDETPGARIVGFHAFRHTLLARAANSEPPVDAGSITGHVDPTKSSVVRGYEGELLLPTKLRTLIGIQLGFSPFTAAGA
jgi:integrase